MDSTSTPAPVASSSKPVDTPRKPPSTPVHTLVLDAGPILSLTPLRGMAERFVAPPQVIAELRDEKARQYWDRIQAGLIEGVEIEVKAPDAISLSKGRSHRVVDGQSHLRKTNVADVVMNWISSHCIRPKDGRLCGPVETGFGRARLDVRHGRRKEVVARINLVAFASVYANYVKPGTIKRQCRRVAAGRSVDFYDCCWPIDGP
jgi:hypothetical protein